MYNWMHRWRSRSILILLCTYPFYSYIATSHLGVQPDYLAGFFFYLILGELLLTKFSNREKLHLPPYLLALGLFVLYTLGSAILISNQFKNMGLIEYLYRDPILKSFVAIFVLENTRFEQRDINRAISFLFFLIIIAALVSIRQIYDPLFFRSEVIGDQFTSLESYQKYLEQLGPEHAEEIITIQEGYRFSIYSWISGISVGMDALAIFSILLGLNSLGGIKRFVVMIAGGFISILSSSRWIMLNFFVLMSQRLFGQRNIVWQSFKYAVSIVLIITAVTFSARYAGFDVEAFVQERLLSKSANTRIYAFKVFREVYRDAPIFGTGGADTEEMLRLIQGKTSQIHVGWLKLLYYHGLVGATIYISFLGLLLAHLFKLARRSAYWGSFFALVGFTVANFTLVELSVFYHGILLAIVFSRYLTNQVSRPDAQTIKTHLKPIRSKTTRIRRHRPSIEI